MERNKTMSNHCVVCLCVYNNEFGLPYCFENIQKMQPVFDRLHVLVFYDISEDRSLEKIEHFIKESTIETIVIMNQDDISLKRMNSFKTDTIAFARNTMLNFIQTWFSEWEYFAMMDTNNYACIGDIRISTLENALLKKEQWDAISFDREAGYYDTWALSFDPFVYSFFHFSGWESVVEQMRHAFSVLLDEYKTNRPDELIPVYSAFNGFSLYKTSMFLNCSYSSIIDIDVFPPNSISNQIQYLNKPIIELKNMDCEHRKFHLEAIQKNNAKIRISTDFLFSKFATPLPEMRGPV